jgi:uncharacterized repeat protein (TIGR03843 family)
MALPLDKAYILQALQAGTIDLQGQFINSSNFTLLAQLDFEGQHLPVVYKPARGERELWDFPAHTLGKREAAAFAFSELLGWNLVPPTIFRRKGPLGRGSLQYFIEHDPEIHYFNFSEAQRQQLRPFALFDLLINNADRKGGHLLLDADSGLWGIDHGVCFHVEDKLRTVIWDFAGQPLPEELLPDVARVAEELAQPESAGRTTLLNLLRPSEVNAVVRRAKRLLKAGVFPQPSQDRRAFPWPPV